MIRKQDIKRVFGSAARCYKAMNITKGAYYQWNDPLSRRNADRVIATAMRLGIEVPKTWLEGAGQ